MMIFPAPSLARNDRFHGKVNHVAMAAYFVSSSGTIVTDLAYRVSRDAKRLRRFPKRGDIAKATSSAPGQLGAFRPMRMLQRRFAGKIWVVGQLWSDANTSKRALFSSVDGKAWSMVLTGLEGGASGSANRFVGIATDGTTLGVLAESGQIAYTTDGAAFTIRANIGFAGTEPATDFAASAGGWVAIGITGQLFTATTISGSFTSRTSGFGTKQIVRIVAGDVFMAVGQDGLCSTCPLNTLTTWTPRSTGATSFLDFLTFGNATWFVAGTGSSLDWCKSTDSGASFTTPTQNPAGGATVPRSGYYDTQKWVMYTTAGVSLSNDNGLTWALNPSAGIDLGKSYLSAYVP